MEREPQSCLRNLDATKKNVKIVLFLKCYTGRVFFYLLNREKNINNIFISTI